MSPVSLDLVLSPTAQDMFSNFSASNLQNKRCTDLQTFWMKNENTSKESVTCGNENNTKTPDCCTSLYLSLTIISTFAFN